MSILSALIILGGLYIGWSLGANDGANSMGTAVGARVRTVREAVVIVGVFSFLGAVLFGHRVVKTIGKGIVPLDLLEPATATMVALAATFAAATWLLVATYLKLPVSTTHSAVGAVAGAGLAVGGAPIYWEKLVEVVLAWVLTPIGGAVCGYLLYQALRLWLLPRFAVSERVWGILLTASGVYMAFSWGSNDVANATGVLVGAGLMESLPATILGGLAIMLGVATWGPRVMETVGSRITHLVPVMAFAAEVAGAFNVFVYSALGIPVSTTHSIVGAIFGVGLVHGRAALTATTARDIILAWAATPVVAGCCSFVLFHCFRLIF